MRYILSVLFSGIVMTCSQAGQKMHPAMVAKDGSVSLPLTDAAVKIEIIGPVAETSLTLTFSNPTGRRLEGEFSFPLPVGATVSGYALDIEGQLIDAVSIEKHRGREVFERIVNRKIDPGLMEHAAGNVFRTRVFPFPPKSPRRLQVRYISEIVNGQYTLPLSFPEPISFKLDVDVAAEYAQLIHPDFTQLKRDEGSWLTNFDNAAFTTDLPLIIRQPEPSEPRVYSQLGEDGKTYFVLHHPKVFAVDQPFKTPGRVVILWDSSHSGDISHEKTFELLQYFFQRFTETTVEVLLRRFRYEFDDVIRFVVRDGDCSALIAELRETIYDGATRLAALGNLSLGDDESCILFSDGMDTCGDPVPVLRSPVTAIVNGPCQDLHALRKLTGALGQIIRLSNPEESASRIGRQVPMYVPEAAVGAETYPQNLVPADHSWTLAGALDGNAEIPVACRQGDRIISSKCLSVTVSEDRGDLLRKYWAMQRLSHLLAQRIPDKKAITELGTTYSLVTPHTSLLVLERLRDYVTYQVRPPAMLPEMRAEYDRKVAKKTRNSATKAVSWDESDKFDWLYVPELEDWTVNRGLRWLAFTQDPSGSWGDESPEHTGLALSAFLEHGETPLSEQYGLIVIRAMKWLANTADRDRKWSCRELAIATSATSESYAMTKIPLLKKPMEMYVEELLDRRLEKGGYAADGKNWDLMTTVWGAEALKAARVAGAANPKLKPTLKQLGQWFEDHARENGTFRSDGSAQKSIPGPGAWAMMRLGRGGRPSVKQAIAQIMGTDLQNLKDMEDEEGWYRLAPDHLELLFFDGHAMFANQVQGGRKIWQTWRQQMEQTLAARQNPMGFWEARKNASTRERAQSTALCGMQLQVYYRYLPTFHLSGSSFEGSMDGMVIEIGEGSKPSGMLSAEQPRTTAQGGLKEMVRQLDDLAELTYSQYLELKKRFGHLPEFYLRAGELVHMVNRQQGRRILFTLAELEADSWENCRDLGNALVALEDWRPGIHFLKTGYRMNPKGSDTRNDFVEGLAMYLQSGFPNSGVEVKEIIADLLTLDGDLACDVLEEVADLNSRKLELIESDVEEGQIDREILQLEEMLQWKLKKNTYLLDCLTEAYSRRASRDLKRIEQVGDSCDRLTLDARITYDVRRCAQLLEGIIATGHPFRTSGYRTDLAHLRKLAGGRLPASTFLPDVTVTLRTTSNLELRVTEPSGRRVDRGFPLTEHGRLDRYQDGDNVEVYSCSNLSGEYLVEVGNHWDGKEVSATVIVETIGKKTKTFEVVIPHDQHIMKVAVVQCSCPNRAKPVSREIKPPKERPAKRKRKKRPMDEPW